MTDIKERLRGEHLHCRCNAYGLSECACDTVWPESACAEAADEIERLEAENHAQFDEISRLDKEIDRLRRDAKPGDGVVSALEKEVEALQEVLSRIRIASEFHAQDGVADHVMRYAHESTKRLCDEALAQTGDSREPDRICDGCGQPLWYGEPAADRERCISADEPCNGGIKPSSTGSRFD